MLTAAGRGNGRPGQPQTGSGGAGEEIKTIPGKIRLLDVVALTRSLPRKGLRRGQVGTVTETLAPQVFEVEFCGNDGRTYASAALTRKQLMVLHQEPVRRD
ncbi:MAG: DUF4926 domain-containing protein [Planctomycetota bacterium]